MADAFILHQYLSALNLDIAVPTYIFIWWKLLGWHTFDAVRIKTTHKYELTAKRPR